MRTFDDDDDDDDMLEKIPAKSNPGDCEHVRGINCLVTCM